MEVDQLAQGHAFAHCDEAEQGSQLGAEDGTSHFLGSFSDGRASLLGCKIDRLGLDQAVARCEHVIESQGYAQHVAVNVAKLVTMRKDEQLRESVRQCELITADGQPIVWASRLLGDPLPERVPGIDLMHGLLARAAVNGYRVYLLGARQAILERAVARLCQEHENLAIVGYRDGYFDDSEEDAVATEIAEARPHILFVAMSSPRKEYFLARHRGAMGVPIVMGVGGAIDIAAGARRRAPIPLQRLGLEWLFRLVQEPRRLWRRYATTNTQFLLLVMREIVAARVAARLRTRHISDADRI